MPNIPFKCRKLTVPRDKGWHKIYLPSGRSICYPSARIENRQITYMGINPYSRKCKRLKTYGRKLCLSKGTLLLTITGWTPIEIVPQDAYVWDGIEWVRTDGSVFNGNEEVIQAYGVWMTPDHQVLTEKGWKSASQSKRYNRSSCRLPDGYELPRFRRKEIDLESTLHLWTRNNHSSNRITKTKKKKYNCLLADAERHKQYHTRTKSTECQNTPHFYCMEQHVSQMYSPFPQSMAKLWRSRNNGLQTVAKKFQQFLGRHGQNIPTRLIFRSHQQQCRLPPQKMPLGYIASTSSKYSTSTIRADSPGTMNIQELALLTGIASSTLYYRLVKGVSPVQLVEHPTYRGSLRPDQLRARNRFVIATPDRPLIVHNCENICQAAA
ncbi:hypothetical protein ARAF_0436 [Arsenophonus endosymbiont of Aleurodicus floccissimus]|nr:hypothetical protein ARAF_0436 [Arsenophonus endosymbiont of Aleurodicus floccissimus]